MRVKCIVCKNEVNGKCKVKNVSVHLNKDRVCDSYEYDDTKVKVKKTNNTSKKTIATKHPLTGDLSRFKTTASRGD